MSGNSTLSSPLDRSLPSESPSPNGYGRDVAAPNANRALWSLRMVSNAKDELDEAVVEAGEEGLTPSLAAMNRADAIIRELASKLANECAAGHKPVLTCAVSRQGEIEIVGYYTGIVGRYTVRIAMNGDYQDLSVVGDL